MKQSMANLTTSIYNFSDKFKFQNTVFALLVTGSITLV